MSLNLYTYCLNNPHKYVDPSGHFVITAAAVLMAVRIGISVFSGVMGAKAEYDRQVAEGDNYTNWGSVLFVGAANAGVSFLTFGIGQGAATVAGAGAKAVLKHVGRAIVRDAAIGALTDAGIETARQLVTGTKITNLEYDRIAEAGVFGGITGGASTLAGAGLEGLMKARVAQSAMKKVNLAASKGADAIKNGFAKVAKKNGKTVGLEAVTELKEPGFKMDLQFFASDEAYQSGSNSSKYQNASLWERLTTRKANVNDLYANPLDEFSNPKIGPSDSAVAKYVREINTTGGLSTPIEVQKLSTGGYEIVNGHHRWMAAQKVGLERVPIQIKNYNN